MKKIIFLVSFLLLASSAHADSRILGKWRDKTKTTINFEFKKNQDFIYTYPNGKNTVEEGVWEIGSWTIGKRQCNLSIYVGELQCCFKYKFIANNLILTSQYKSGSGIYICDNRVLIRETKEEK